MNTDPPADAGNPEDTGSPEDPDIRPEMLVVRRYTRADLIANLARLAGQPAPDITRQDVTGIAVAQVHLTNLAHEAGVTWRQIAGVFSHRSPAVAKRNHRRLEAALRRELVLRTNAN